VSRKKPEQAHANHERWLVSYADFITLLFAFFVVMFASSQTDKARAKAVSESVTQALENGGIKPAVHAILGGTVDDKGQGNNQMKGPGGAQAKKAENAAVAELAPSMQYLTQSLQQEIKLGKIEVRLEPRGLIVSLRQATFFPSGEDTIDPGTKPILDKICTTILQLPNAVRLEGHTDSVPIHTARFRTNWELSAARAIAVLELLNSQYAVPRERLAVAGYADTIPAAPNDTPEGRAHNRRVDIVILNQNVLITNSAGEPTPAHAPEKKK
jgi:chemotaxis protein MotB